MSYPRLLPVGDIAFTIEFGNAVDRDLSLQVHAFDAQLQADPFPALIETIPSYRSLLIVFDPQIQPRSEVREVLSSALLSPAPTQELPRGRLLEIPVCYGGACGPDLTEGARHCKLSETEVIRRHSTPEYLVAMLGFSPGFAYLLGLLPELATPRLSTPRLSVPAGSIGIADQQTGIYSLRTPGGWQLIGRTQLTLFDPGRPEPFTLRAGDRIRFVPSHA